MVGSCIPIHACRCLPDPKCLSAGLVLWMREALWIRKTLACMNRNQS